ncbi:MAG: hypothetical protein ABIU63_12955 [Chitinophagaceae bacterium]
MNRNTITIIAMAFFAGCSSAEPPATGAPGPDSSKTSTKITPAASDLQQVGDSFLIPSFDIEVHLTPGANEKLSHDKETIIVAAWFSGDPRDTTSAEYAESGQQFIKFSEIELTGSNRVAKFDGIKFSKAAYDSLASKDLSVLINVYSGRRTTQDNLLDCSILSDKISAVKGKQYKLSGKLITESGPLPE